MIICTNCGEMFEDDDDLEVLNDDNGQFRGCPFCETDSYLMDIDDF